MYGHFWVGITDKKYAHACTHTQTYLWIQKQAGTSVKTHWGTHDLLASSLLSQTQLIIFSLWIHFSLNLSVDLSRSLCVCLHVWMCVFVVGIFTFTDCLCFQLRASVLRSTGARQRPYKCVSDQHHLNIILFDQRSDSQTFFNRLLNPFYSLWLWISPLWPKITK